MGSIHDKTCYTDIDAARKKVSVPPELVYINLDYYNKCEFSFP
jgi:hypothetical protein